MDERERRTARKHINASADIVKNSWRRRDIAMTTAVAGRGGGGVLATLARAVFGRRR